MLAIHHWNSPFKDWKKKPILVKKGHGKEEINHFLSASFLWVLRWKESFKAWIDSVCTQNTTLINIGCSINNRKEGYFLILWRTKSATNELVSLFRKKHLFVLTFFDNFFICQFVLPYQHNTHHWYFFSIRSTLSFFCFTSHLSEELFVRTKRQPVE